MGHPQYLIDTNVIIDYLGLQLPNSGMVFMNEVINAIPYVSIISKIEVLGFDAPAEDYQLLVSFMNDATILDLTSAVVDSTISIRKASKIKLPDAIIAATALVYDLALITRNVDDFKNLTEFKMINPHEL